MISPVMMPITNANATATVTATTNAKTASESLEFLTKVDQFLATCAEKPLPAHSDDRGPVSCCLLKKWKRWQTLCVET
jgi:hypothetical protein